MIGPVYVGRIPNLDVPAECFDALDYDDAPDPKEDEHL